MKVFVFDLDGTVLNSKNEFPKETKELILNISEKGDKVIFATGRMHASAEKLLRNVFGKDVDFPIISYNGALAYVPVNGFVFEKYLKKETVDRVIDYARKKNIHVQTYAGDKLWTEKDDEEIKLYSKHADVPYYVIEDLKCLDESVFKVLYVAKSEILDSIIDEVRNIAGKDATVFKSFSIFLDIVPSDANKGIALEFLAKKLGFDLKETVVFGDNENDIFMFNVAGHKIAVGNAVEKLKEVADYVTSSNEENGVLQAFKILYPDYVPDNL